MKYKKILTLMFLVVLHNSGLLANEIIRNTEQMPVLQPSLDILSFVSFRGSLGYLEGESHEFVYDNVSDEKLSELIWSIDSAVMLSGGMTVDVNSWLRFNVDLSISIGDGENTLDNYDWYISGYDWTDWSYSDDVSLTKGYIFDVNAQFTIVQLKKTTITTSLGYRIDNWKWEARGGGYVYSYSGFRDSVGSFPDGGLGITYEQWFNSPYIGLGINSCINDFEILGETTFSPFVSSESKDQHYLRNLLFEDDFESGNMFSLELEIRYSYTENITFSASMHSQIYEETRGNTTITDNNTKEVTLGNTSSSGRSLTYTLIKLSIEYQF